MRWRKDNPFNQRYHVITMLDHDQRLYAKQTVDQILRIWPGTAQVFLRYKTECVGCFMMHFCTLEEVAAIYALSLEQVLEDLSAVAASPMPSSQSDHFTGG